MKLQAPIVAMLWENWRLTRTEAAVRLGVGVVAASAALALMDAGATAALWILVAVNAYFWFSIAKLNGGRFMDGYKPSFPLHLLYSRPVRTATFVGVAMLYDAVSCAALYVVSAALVGFAFGQPLPLFSVAVWIVAFHLSCTCIQWSTPNRVVQWVASIAVGWPMFFLFKSRVWSPLQFQFSMVDYAVLAAVGALSIGLTVAGVARQRRGDAVAQVTQEKTGSGGYPVWLVNLFRFPCPTSSATRAQVWFEFKATGLPVLAIGLTMAVMIFLLYSIGIAVAPVRPAAVAAPIMFGLPMLLLLLGGNAFGIRKRQGRSYVSAFEATQPYDTAQLAGVKVLVRTACLLAALIAFGVSLWASSSLMSAWGEYLADGKVDVRPGLLKARQTFADTFGGQTGAEFAAKSVVLAVAVALLVAWLATFKALRMRYPRRLLVAGSLLLLASLAVVLLALAKKKGFAPELPVGAIFRVMGWTAMTATVIATIYFISSGFARRALTIRYVGGALVILAAFGAAWVMLMRGAGLQPGAMSGMGVARVLWPLIPLLLVSFLAPWSLNRVRHL